MIDSSMLTNQRRATTLATTAAIFYPQTKRVVKCGEISETVFCLCIEFYQTTRHLSGEMVLRCAWGICNADERYPERLRGGYFVRFPTPKRDLEKCKRWIKACGRPHDQLNVSRINQHKAVCSKHFVGGNGPSKEFPDPIAADGTQSKPSRKAPRKRSAENLSHNAETLTKRCPVLQENINILNNTEPHTQIHVGETVTPGTFTQTDEPWTSALDILALAVENHNLQQQLEQKTREITMLKSEIASKNKTIEDLNRQMGMSKNLSVEIVNLKEKKLKGLFQYYTGITYIRFLALFSFVLPNGTKMEYSTGREDIKKLSDKNGLFLTLCRFRHGFGLTDIATRFGLCSQSASIVFNAWLDLMYFKLGQLSIWPHRREIIRNMPAGYRKDFPTTLIIIDGTEIKTQTPSALSLQSQLYSDYKSSTTLKGLIGCDPNGCLMFVSELFTGSVSDKAITEQSGFYNVIKTLKEAGYIEDGDAIMVDKGFNIHKEMDELGLQVNIPPFASAGRQLTSSETVLTHNIAKHRVHIERLICKVKTYKLLSHCVPTSLFSKVNRIWSVCCHLTLFQDVFVK